WRARHGTRERRPWLALTLATGCWTVGAVYHLLAHGGGSTTAVPTGLDAVGYLLFYPLAFAGLAGLMRSRLRTHATLPWLDGAIAGVGTAAAALALVGGLLAERAGDSPAELLAKIGFPIGDLVLLALVAVMWGLRGMRGRRSWYLVSGGVGVMAAADLSFTAFAAQSDLAVQVLRPMWGVGMILIGLGAWRGEPEEADVHPEGGQLVLPWLFAGVAVTVLLAGQSGDVPVAAAALAALTVVAVMFRATAVLRENKLLLDARQQAVTDDLTGLPNRRMFNALLRRLDLGGGRPVGILMMDLNRFKQLNDALGHRAGDQLLQELAPRLRQAAGDGGTVGRLGGDEFAMVVEGADEALLAAVADAVLRAIRRPFVIEGLTLQVDASVGGALAPGHADDPSTLLRCADVAMYAAKRDGAGYALYRPGTDHEGAHDHDRLRLVEPA
ncbi:MAG TPA: GGDEF domain-containing protein, partial [Thermoleophilaceae bacterium]|nr:GGDEF domain-containing protein [Thermoleophilaceae bacterium]